MLYKKWIKENCYSCYKKLGLIDPVKPANKYWPGNFSTENLPDPDSDAQMVLLGDGNELS